MNSFFKETPDGIVISIRIQPRAKKIGINGTHDGALKIGVNSPPIDGRANEELTTLLAELLDVPKRSISIIKGELARDKKVLVAGVLANNVADLLKINS
jgi:uncharacterized protein (TIGR00251 family)